MLKLANRILLPFGRRIIRTRESDALSRELSVLSSLVELYSGPINSAAEPTAVCVVFSMDRAMQLHALLGSYFELAANPWPVKIFYRASSSDHRKAYDSVFERFPARGIEPVYQERKDTFRSQLLALLGSIGANKVIFLVDDIIFTEQLDMHDFASVDSQRCIASLRLGENLRRAYTVQQDQQLPPFIEMGPIGADKRCWIWKTGEHDWGYPLSVDGNLFLAHELLLLARNIDFDSPNTFEANLQVFSKYFRHRMGMCYKKSKIINLPINKIQSDYDNIHGSVHQDSLLEEWKRGMQIDYRALYGIQNQSAHQEVEISLIKRSR